MAVGLFCIVGRSAIADAPVVSAMLRIAMAVPEKIHSVVDDLVSTGGTLVRAAKAARAHGAKEVIACVAHGLFMPGAESALADPSIDRIIATDSVPPFRLAPGPVLAKLDIISAAPLFAETIRRLHHNETVDDLLPYQA